MPVSNSSTPYQSIWSRNPAKFVFSYSLVSLTYKLEVNVYDAVSSASLATVQYPFSSTSGSMTIDLQEIFDSIHANNLPMPNTTLGAASEEITSSLVKQVKVKFRLSNTGVTETWQIISTTFKVLKGGIGKLNFVDEASVNHGAAFYYPDVGNTGNTYLSVLKRYHVVTDDRMWLLFFNKANQDVTARYLIYTESSFTSLDVALPNTTGGSMQWRAWYVPFGLTQIGVTNPNEIKRIVVRIFKTGAPATIYSELEFYVDQRPWYRPLNLYFRNSYGGWEFCKFTGLVEPGTSTDKKMFEQKRDGATAGVLAGYDSRMTVSFKANSGHLNSLDDAASFMDMMNARQYAILVGNKWVPVVNKTKSVPMKNNANALNSFTIEFETAGDFQSLPEEIFSL
jgi:hypothetical protein